MNHPQYGSFKINGLDESRIFQVVSTYISSNFVPQIFNIRIKTNFLLNGSETCLSGRQVLKSLNSVEQEFIGNFKESRN